MAMVPRKEGCPSSRTARNHPQALQEKVLSLGVLMPAIVMYQCKVYRYSNLLPEEQSLIVAKFR